MPRGKGRAAVAELTPLVVQALAHIEEQLEEKRARIEELQREIAWLERECRAIVDKHMANRPKKAL
jgi:type II secretory pathway component PulJ